MGRGLHCLDQRLSRRVSFEAAEFLGGNHDDFIAAVHCYVLRPFGSDPANQLAEARFGVL